MPKFSERSFLELVDIAYGDRKVLDDAHEVWTILAEGSTE
jgi:hypothetical protein